MTTDLTEQSIYDALAKYKSYFKDLAKEAPTKVFIPSAVRKMLAGEGYDTEEKISDLVSKLLSPTMRIK